MSLKNAQAQQVPGLPTVNEGDMIEKWKIIKKLGEGGFGAVYKVSGPPERCKEECALKTERVDSTVRVLKMEVVVLKALKLSGAIHCCDVFDTGKANGYHYIVMTLVGSSLQDLRKNSSSSNEKFCKFSLSTSVLAGMQCLEALQEIHNIGYLHRDIKPANFAIGLNQPRKILLLDFGMCRRYIDFKNNIRNPRWAAGFRGTLRYAAISAHISREMSRKDDLETWMYQQIEFTSGQLPWKHLEDLNQVCMVKEKSRTVGTGELFAGCPKEYISIMVYIDSLCYYDNPNYAILRGLLKEVIDNNNINMDDLYDWEKKSSSSKQSTKNDIK